MRKFFPFLFLPLLICGCVTAIIQQDTLVPSLETWQVQALERNLAGETAAALSQLARQSTRGSRREELPDLARFVRENPPEQGTILSRKMLWECMELCNTQFSPAPEKMIREFREGELRCRTALLIAEKQFLDQVIWKTPKQQQRSSEVDSELSQLCGNMPFSELSAIKLVMPQETADFTANAAIPVSQDPAEALQIAGVICLLPVEIRRQMLADPEFSPEGILKEVQFLASSYALLLDLKYLNAALAAYKKEPSAENLWLFRKWYYRAQLDNSRRPAERGTAKDRQFINSMLLLQESF